MVPLFFPAVSDVVRLHLGSIMNYQIIAIGASLGGMEALRTLLAFLPRHFPVPLAAVLHRHAESEGEIMTAFFQKQCVLEVIEAEDKTSMRPGHVYLAPADYHLMVESDHFALSSDDFVNHARPSIDVFFESVAEVYGKRAVGVILTGFGKDGAQGLAAIKRAGGLTIVQSPDSAWS